MNAIHKLAVSVALVSALAALGAAPSSGATLQLSNATTGNQAYSGVGLEFQVNAPISVTSLGIYDSGQDGIAASPSSPLSAYLMTLTGTVEASTTFSSADQGVLDLVSLYRFKSISPVTLSPGNYYLMGYGWSASDPLHNCNLSGPCETFNTAGGLVTFVAGVYGDGSDPAGTLPTNLGFPTNFFSAANMEFSATPLPAALPLFASGLGALGLLGWRRKRKAAAIAA